VGHILGRKTKIAVSTIHYTNVAALQSFLFVLQFVGIWNLLAYNLWTAPEWQVVKNIILMLVGSMS
jgi:hypothetical protein